MNITLINTDRGLVPCTDEDYELKKQLSLGEAYVCTIKVARNVDFHRKYFKMVSTAWEFLPEHEQFFFKNRENFRKYLEMAAGYTDIIYSPKREEWIEVPRSIAFDKLDQAGFEKVYNDVRNVIDSLLRPYITEKEFEENILRF